jgi:RimJ/RimL family protein N-acetyltransferase
MKMKINGPTSISDLSIRPLVASDARDVLDLLGEVFSRCRTTLTSAEEFAFSEEQERDYLLKFSKAPNLALGAFRASSLLGTIFLEQLPHLRTRHRGSIGLSVHPDCWSQGIGSRLLQALISQAQGSAELRSIEASVLANNPYSERLFRSAGFRLDAVHREAAFIDGVYLDEKFFVLRLRK